VDIFQKIEKYLTAVQNGEGHQIQHGKIKADKTGELEGLENVHADKLTTLYYNADYAG
jgi:hypothetical protein